MMTYAELNSTFDNSSSETDHNEFVLYGEKIIVDSNVLHHYNSKFNINLKEKYEVGECIYSQRLTPTSIYLATDLLDSSKVVIKELKKVKMLMSYVHEFARNEMAIHHSLSNYSKCNNIVKMKEYFEDYDNYYMVMERSPDPNFFEDLLENKYIPISDERVLKAYALDILNALIEVHKNNVIHCDIKPQNFMIFNMEDSDDVMPFRKSSNHSEKDLSFVSYDPNSFLKLTDFGLSHLIPYGNNKAHMKLRCGTFGYSAPEIGKDSFVDQSIDMWAFGICLYQMAVAYMPTAIKQYKYGTGSLPFRKIDWNAFDFVQLKNLIENCIQMKPEKRITALQAISHPWFELD